MEEKKVGDILGIAPYGEAMKLTIEKSFEGAAAFLGAICMPVAEELGLMLKDKVRYWRMNNIAKIIEKSKGKMQYVDGQVQLNAHPKVVKEIIENGSYADDNDVQELWAGLLASSCTKNNGSDSNLIFINTLKDLTVNQIRVLNFICQRSIKKVDANGLTHSDKELNFNLDELRDFVDISNIHQLDAELDHLRSKELLSLFSGLNYSETPGITVELQPSAFALMLYVKGQGFSGSVKDYFNLKHDDIKKKQNQEKL